MFCNVKSKIIMNEEVQIMEQKMLHRNIPNQYRELYKQAVCLINLERAKDMEMSIELFRIENRVQRFERLIDLGAPNFVIEDESKLIRRSVEELKSN